MEALGNSIAQNCSWGWTAGRTQSYTGAVGNQVRFVANEESDCYTKGKAQGSHGQPHMPMAENTKLTPDGEFFLFKTSPNRTRFSFLSPLTGISLEDDWPREDEVATGLKSYTVLHCIDYLHAFCLGSFVMFILIMFCLSFAVCIEVCLKHCFGLPLWAKKDSYTTSYLLRAKYKVTVN